MKLPVHRLATTNEFLILAFGCHLQIFSISTGQLLASTLDRPKDERHDELIRLITTTANSNLLVSTGEDKKLCVWQLPEMKLLSKRELNKRATALTLEPDETHVVVADKFGDVYRYEIDVKEPVPSTSKVEPILGHVSLLTTALITRNGKRIITGDRDEHIRISEFPCGWNIETYLGGHSRFISTLLLCDEDRILLSAGGDTKIFVWNLATFKLETKLDISILSSTVENHAQIEKITRSGFKKKKKFKTAQDQSTVGNVRTDSTSVEMTEGNGQVEEANENGQAEEAEGNGQVEEEEVGEPTHGRETSTPLAIHKILEISKPRHCLLVACSGGTGLLTLPIENWKENASREILLNLQFPILDFIKLNQNHILVTLDVTKPSTEMSTVENFKIFDMVDSDECIKPSASFDTLLDSLQTLASTEESSTLPLPDATSLYPELALLNKDGFDPNATETNGFHHESTKRAGQVGAEPAPKRAKKHQKG